MKYLILLLLMLSFVVADCESGQININSAPLGELDELTGIGPAKGQAIIDTRPFDKVDELINVYGIGDATLAKIKTQGLACVEGEVVEDNSNEEIEEEVVDEIEEVVSRNDKPIVLEKPNKVISLGGSSSQDSEPVYISKNGKIGDYLPYGFALFLIFIIGFLVLERF